jgi:hypothetical protein
VHIPRQQAHGAMHRCQIKTTHIHDKKVKQKWTGIPWQFCPVCKMMLMD